MDSLELPHAKILYCIYQLSESSQITAPERMKLKELLAADSPKILCTLNEAANDSVALNRIIKLVRPKHQMKPTSIIPSRAYGDELSSPLGSYLLDQKKRQYEEQAFHISLQQEPSEEALKISAFNPDH